MQLTLAEAKARAATLARAGEGAQALFLCGHVLAQVPADDALRLRIADLLAEAEPPAGGASIDKAEARGLLRLLADHLIRAGRPLLAIAACHRLIGLGEAADDLLAACADSYAAGSDRLAPVSARPTPPDPATPVDAPSSDEPRTWEEVAPAALAQALDLSGASQPQTYLHPVAFLSELAADQLRAVLASLTVRRMKEGELAVRQGEPGTSLFLVGSGALEVYADAPTGERRVLAVLHENSLFGEMALMTSQPRAASVAARSDADVLEISRESLDRVKAEIPSLQIALDRFARERLIKNLLATSPLFTPFTKDQQAELLKRFEGMEVDTGTPLIAEGEEGQGLYIVLSGELVVTVRAAGEGAPPVELARLGTGAIVGEMSLLSSQRTSATVTATSRCNLLFLARVYFERLSAAIPEVRAYFAGIAERRAQDNSTRLSAAALPEEAIDIDESEFVLL